VHFVVFILYNAIPNAEVLQHQIRWGDKTQTASRVFPSGFPTKTMYMPFLSPYVLHAQPISFVSIISPEQY